MRMERTELFVQVRLSGEVIVHVITSERQLSGAASLVRNVSTESKKSRRLNCRHN